MHKARKRFGQNFLHDAYVIQRIILAIAPQPGQHLVEIGPGQGALTFPLLRKAGKLDVIEIDRDLVGELKKHQEAGELIIHEQDALEFDFSQLSQEKKSLRVFGNLPYNISTPIIFHLLKYAPLIHDMYFMLQKEVVDRIVSLAGSREYGRLSVMVQYHCQTDVLFDVPPSAFSPQPKVNSSILHLIPYDKLPYVAKEYGYFAEIVREAFCHRRKTLRNCLKNFINDEGWIKANIDPQLRPEELTVADFVRLSNLRNEI